MREEESVDGPAHQCSLSPDTQQMLKKCFKDIVSAKDMSVATLMSIYSHV